MAATGFILRIILLILGFSLAVPSALFAQNESLFRQPRIFTSTLAFSNSVGSCYAETPATPSSTLRIATAGAYPDKTGPLTPSRNFSDFSDACPDLPVPPLMTPPPGHAKATFTPLGKQGIEIERTRDSVFALLSSDNACTEWFRTKDPAPAQVFASLGYSIDRHGQADVFELVRDNLSTLFVQPYVASATQAGGAYTTITINAAGAFYRTQGNIQKKLSKEGPGEWAGTHALTVGEYLGDTLPARIVTLLHELGHVVDLLPWDGDSLDGNSVRNTDEVLRHCRTEIDAAVRSAKDSSRHSRAFALAVTQSPAQP